MFISNILFIACSSSWYSTHSLTYSLTYSLTHSLTHILTHSLTHSLTHILTHILTHSLIHSPILGYHASDKTVEPPINPVNLALIKSLTELLLSFLYIIINHEVAVK